MHAGRTGLRAPASEAGNSGAAALNRPTLDELATAIAADHLAPAEPLFVEAIARPLILEPELPLLEEPTAALDGSIQAAIRNLLNDLRRGRVVETGPRATNAPPSPCRIPRAASAISRARARVVA